MKLLIALLPLLFLISCNEPTYEFNYDLKEDFSQLKTYSWQDSQNEKDALMDHWLFRKKVMIVADKILAEKGYTLVSDSSTEANFHCVLLGVIQSDTSITVREGSGSSVGYGVGYGSYGYGGMGGYNYGSSYASSYGSNTYNASGGFDENGGYGGYGHYGGAQPTSVAVGVSSGGGRPTTTMDVSNDIQFFFDIVDVKEQKLVWRTKVSQPDADPAASAEDADNYVRTMVGTILANFPPPKK